MSYLLDTHTLLWFRLEPNRLTASQRDILADNRSLKYISTLSIWEISLKFGLGKLDLGGHTPEEFLDSALALGLHIVEPSPHSFASFHQLASVTDHRDPFDRMLIWQAIQSNFKFVSSDRKLADYKIHGLQIAPELQ